jgi:murein DD-endopeptidase MepM/ murein hydrolase activator NlpD
LVIHDYKSRLELKSPKHQPKRSRAPIGLAALFLGATALAVSQIELTGTNVPSTSPAGPLVAKLSLPDRPAASPASTARDTPDAPVEPRVAEDVALATPPPTAAAHANADSIPRRRADAVVDEADLGPSDGTAPVGGEIAAAPAASPPRWVEFEITRGDTLAKLFQQAALSAALLHRITHSSDTAASLAKIRPGQTLRLRLDSDGELTELVLQRDRVSSLRIQAVDDGFAAAEERRDLERTVVTATGVIESSLFVDGQKAGLDDNLIMELAAIFGWDIDFALEIRAGDHFSVVYEELYLEGEKVRNGDILAAEFVNQGHAYRAVRFLNESGDVAYYDPEGRSKRRAFIRTPVKFARVSSGFTTRRWHPVLKTWRSHKGVDYAAPTGTPVKATGDGKVTFRGRKGGYGKVVFIEHAGRYTTVYGHLSKFSSRAKNGSRVKQGQVIGYVGQTGLATGPHLHYEFRVDGVHRNPLTVKLPKSAPLPKSQLATFQEQAEPLLARLDKLGSTMLAEADTNRP